MSPKDINLKLAHSSGCVFCHDTLNVLLRQETDGTQAEEFLPCGPKLHKSRRMEGAGPCPDTLLILEVKGNSPITHLQKSSLEVKKGGSTTPK